MLQKGGGTMIECVEFMLGERKQVCISVVNKCKEPFDITSATWELKKGDETEAHGDCEIDQRSDTETRLTALIQPMAKGATYHLIYNYEIPPQILMAKIKVNVR